MQILNNSIKVRTILFLLLLPCFVVVSVVVLSCAINFNRMTIQSCTHSQPKLYTYRPPPTAQNGEVLLKGVDIGQKVL